MKSKISLYIILIFACSVTQTSFSQIKLSPENAVALAMQYNFNILLAKNDVENAQLNNNAGAAGMLPKLALTASEIHSRNNIYQELSNGTVTSKDFVPVNQINAGLNLTWTLFDGMKMFATRDRLKALQSVSEIQLKDQIQNSVAQVLSTYYQIVQLKLQVKYLEELIKLYDERVSLSEKKFEVGYADKSPLLQAKVDIASQRVNILKQKNALSLAKASLNQLMGREPNMELDVADTFFLSGVPPLSTLLDSSNHNNMIYLAQKNLEISQYQKKEINSQMLPSLQLNGGYNLSQNNSQAGLIMVNRSNGPQVGLGANVPIFSGGVYRKQLQAADVQIRTRELQVKQTLNAVHTQIFNAYQNYNFATAALKLTEDNVKVATENVQLSMAKFKLNQATTLDIKTAQNSLEQALYDVNTTRYNAIVAEIELKRIANLLVR